MHVHQLPHAPGVVLAGPPRAHPDVTPAPQWLAHHELSAHALTLMKQCLEKEPENKSYKKLQNRYEAGDPKADVPDDRQ
jgi:hypothetical protein